MILTISIETGDGLVTKVNPVEASGVTSDTIDIAWCFCRKLTRAAETLAEVHNSAEMKLRKEHKEGEGAKND